MKKLFKNRYFSFLMIYLCILCIFSTGLSLSQYTTNDTATDDSGVAIYDVLITNGESTENSAEVSMSVHATSKLSEPTSMLDGTYEKMQINVTNYSECKISLSDFILSETASGRIYEKIIIPMTKQEIEDYQRRCGSVPLMLLDYLGMTAKELGSMDLSAFNGVIAEKNTEAFTTLEDSSEEINIGETKTFFVISWVEHDSVYKADADNNADKISHITLGDLGVKPETFKVTVESKQIDWLHNIMCREEKQWSFCTDLKIKKL